MREDFILFYFIQPATETEEIKVLCVILHKYLWKKQKRDFLKLMYKWKILIYKQSGIIIRQHALTLEATESNAKTTVYTKYQVK